MTFPPCTRSQPPAAAVLANAQAGFDSSYEYNCFARQGSCVLLATLVLSGAGFHRRHSGAGECRGGFQRAVQLCVCRWCAQAPRAGEVPVRGSRPATHLLLVLAILLSLWPVGRDDELMEGFQRLSAAFGSLVLRQRLWPSCCGDDRDPGRGSIGAHPFRRTRGNRVSAMGRRRDGRRTDQDRLIVLSRFSLTPSRSWLRYSLPACCIISPQTAAKIPQRLAGAAFLATVLWMLGTSGFAW